MAAAVALTGYSLGANESAAATPARCGSSATTGRKTLDYFGLARTYQLSLPRSYNRRTPAPVILNLHGLTSNIDEQDIISNFPKLGGARGYVIVTPQALASPESPQLTQWNLSQDASFTQSLTGHGDLILTRFIQPVETLWHLLLHKDY